MEVQKQLNIPKSEHKSTLKCFFKEWVAGYESPFQIRIVLAANFHLSSPLPHLPPRLLSPTHTQSQLGRPHAPCCHHRVGDRLAHRE
jgi:hypothetical protein